MKKQAGTRQEPIPRKTPRRLRRRTLEWLVIGGVILASVIIIAAIILSNPPGLNASLPDKSEPVPDQGRPHVALGAPHPPYNSNPPTSGWHYVERPLKWGSFLSSLPDELMVFNLEQGGIWITYRDAADAEAALQLQEIVRRYPTNVILTHRPANDSRIAIAAWGRVLKLDSIDSEQIYNFIARYQFKGPENSR